MINLNIMIPIILFSQDDYERTQNKLNRKAEIIHKVLQDDNIFPNNKLPAILYKGVIDLSSGSEATIVEQLFQVNGWGNSWRNGIYGFHHYHSTAHEVLGVYSGSASVRLGGDRGETFELEIGDVVLIPAGVAHKNLWSSNSFKVVGAYPKGQNWDMNYGRDGERPGADLNIKNVPLPDFDPVFGDKGPVEALWEK
jgi:uncharacterized protein YjlB